jgi:hypothetical protein
MAMEPFTPYFVILLVVLVAAGSFAWQFGRSRNIIEEWAAGQGLTLLGSEYRPLRMGPFFFRHGKNQTVYYVTVRDQLGRIRHAYVRCGGWFMGLLSDAVAVEWAD